MHRSYDAIQVCIYDRSHCGAHSMPLTLLLNATAAQPCAASTKQCENHKWIMCIMGHIRLQEDCQVCLNTVENIEQFLLDINQGRWDTVLPQITHLRLPTEKLYDLYEQIVCEMIELRETDTARAMLRTMKVFKRLQQDSAERFMRLDRMSNPCAPRIRPALYTCTLRSAKGTHCPSQPVALNPHQPAHVLGPHVPHIPFTDRPDITFMDL